ncbi:hypothetical protein, partial [Chitinimonas sp.]|uniref:COG3904 family protein n=1 Tax=Chitinimonas sp. TaxID=1934313 RepID=UPI002F955408
VAIPEPVEPVMEAPAAPARVSRWQAEAAPEAPSRHRFFLLRHWRGEMSLAASFWGMGLLCSLLINPAIVAGLQWVSNADTSMQVQGGAVFVGFGLSLLIAIWLWVGNWRAGSRAASAGSRWGRVVQVLVVLGVLSRAGLSVQSELPELREAADWVRGIEQIPQPVFNLLRDGTELELAGGIAFGTARQFRTYLDEHPQIALIHLNSSGGRISEAIRIGDVIRERHINTYTSNTCVSACALAFLGGTYRYVGAKGRLGFHSAYVNLSNPVATFAGNQQQAEQLRRVGAPEEFIRHATSVAPTDMWFPTRDELLSSGVVSEIVSGKEFALSGVDAEGRSEAGIDKELRSVPYAQAMAEHYPQDYARFKAMMVDGLRTGRSLGEIMAQTTPLLAKEVIPKALKLASDHAVADFWRAHLRKLQAQRKSSPEACVLLEFPDAYSHAPDGTVVPQSPEDLKLELEAMAAVIRTSATEPTQEKPPFGTAQKDLTQIVTGIYQNDHSQGEALRDSKLYTREPAILCGAVIALYKDILALDERRSANIMRYIANQQEAKPTK